MTNRTITMVDSSLGGVIREYIEYNGELTPTDYVHIDVNKDGKPVKYRMVDRKAEVGEKVIITVGGEGWYEKKVGQTFTVINGGMYGRSDDFTYVDYMPSKSVLSFVVRGEYRVLEPVADEADSDKVIDMLTALSQKVVELECKMNDLADANERAIKRVADRTEENGKNVLTLAQDLEAVKAVMLELDDRTNPSPKSTGNIVANYSVYMSQDGETNVDITFRGNPSPTEMAQAFTNFISGGVGR